MKGGGGSSSRPPGIYGKKYGHAPRPGSPSSSRRRAGWSSLEIDVQGAIQVKEADPRGPSAYFVLPAERGRPCCSACENRKREDRQAIQRRYDAARQEIATARSCGVYDTFIVNGTVEQAIGEAVEGGAEGAGAAARGTPLGP